MPAAGDIYAPALSSPAAGLARFQDLDISFMYEPEDLDEEGNLTPKAKKRLNWAVNPLIRGAEEGAAKASFVVVVAFDVARVKKNKAVEAVCESDHKDDQN
jgi:hypothetical protein